MKNKLLDEGWAKWNKKDFFNFVRMAEKYGRDGVGGRAYLECIQSCCKKSNQKLKNNLKLCFNRKCAGICFDFTPYMEVLPHKQPEEILDYAEAFWQNFNKIENGHKYIERIEKGELEIERRRLVDLSIKLKFDYHIKAFKEKHAELSEFGLDDILLEDTQDTKDLLSFSLVEDKVCALGLFRYGYGHWELIRNDLRNCK